MTTFYMHRVRCFKRLKFGTNSATKLFNEEMSQMLVDTENADNLYDDMIISSCSKLEYDIALEQVLQQFEDSGLTLGLPKCQFDQTEIEFFGTKLLAEGMKRKSKP